MKQYDKLIRDRIPEIIASTGARADIRILSDAEYPVYLERKLDEEVAEVHQDRNAEELADILEVIYALAADLGISQEKLHQVYRQKHDARGGFEKKLLLVSTEKGE